MPDVQIDETSMPIADASDATDIDRRRPGRVDAHPSLIAVLRAPAEVEVTEEDRRFLELDEQRPEATAQEDRTDRLAAARGLVLASLLALPVWLVIGVTFYLLLR